MGALLDVGGELGERVADARRPARRRARHLPTTTSPSSPAPTVDAAIALVNAFAPEHLELHLADAAELVARIRNAGAVFVGPHAATAFADYAAGTNHVLPTGGSARFAQGLSVVDFQKRVGVVELDRAAAAGAGAVRRRHRRRRGPALARPLGGPSNGVRSTMQTAAPRCSAPRARPRSSSRC